MSFIDLMGAVDWSEADIKARLHAEIRSEISEYKELELSRALFGLFTGLHALTSEEQAELMQFKVLTDRVAVLGTSSRADMVLLRVVFAMETAVKRLSLPPKFLDDPDVQEPDPVDVEERLAAQAVIDAATPEQVALFDLRNPGSPSLLQEPTP